jgi:hypothetical protein
MPAIQWESIPSPIIQRGTRQVAHRDAAIHFHDGVFRVFYGMAQLYEEGRVQFQLAVTESTDLISWSEPRALTTQDDDLNFTDPGNIVRFGDEWIMTVENYRTRFSPAGGSQTARSWIMRSTDLVDWSEPELMLLKGPDVPDAMMGRCIGPCLFEDRHEAGKWWCFFKHGGFTNVDSRNLAYGGGHDFPHRYALMSSLNMSFSYDLLEWTYFARADSEENYCVLVEDDGYVLIDAPYNGIGVRMSTDLVHWHEVGLYTLGQRGWPWAHGRLTGGHVIDLRHIAGVGKYVMVFHGCTQAGKAASNIHGEASLGIAWSDDLANWYWPE